MTPQPILKKIQEAKDKQLKQLSLRESKLTEIPVEVFELEQLEELDLTDNKIKIIPEEIRKLKNLKRIDVDKNPLETIQDISGLCIDFEQYKKFKPILTKENIFGLVIENQKDFPEEVTELSALSLLEIKKMEGASEQILNFKILTTLGLYECNLVEIPEHISKLEKLTSLSLSGNQIKEIPEHIIKLENLTSLYLSSNQIKEIPEHIIKLENLTFLYLI
ncbi:MAG: leucine-rich repeat domain-containing protein [Leptospiraceae bacterium]|nr:leucine-rich repeat domain-containing protein [Leptospiraceae bacterium]